MDLTERSAFSDRLRYAFENEPLDLAEALLIEAARPLADSQLDALLRTGRNHVNIANWDALCRAIDNARGDKVRTYGSLILRLIHRNESSDMKIVALFAEHARAFTINEGETQAALERYPEMAAIVRTGRSRGNFPDRPYFSPPQGDPGLRLVGLEHANQLQKANQWSASSTAEESERQAKRSALAAGLVFLRFCQTVEGLLLADGNRQWLPTFVGVDFAEWPMETNTIDYCEQAVRLIPAERRTKPNSHSATMVSMFSRLAKLRGSGR